MSRQRTSQRLTIRQLAAFADTTAEFGETELTRPWAETLIAVAVAAVIAHFSEGSATVLAGAAAAILAAVGVDAVRRTDARDLPRGSELPLAGLMGLATAGAARLVPTGVGLIAAIVIGSLLLRAVVIWELRVRRIPGGATHRDRVGALAVSTFILFAASIGVAALVPGVISVPGTPSARPDAVGPLAILAVGIGSAIAAGLLAGRMASLRRERTSGIVRDALSAALLNGLASIVFAKAASCLMVRRCDVRCLLICTSVQRKGSAPRAAPRRLLTNLPTPVGASIGGHDAPSLATHWKTRP
ncbi:MAG: hypothetical protein ACKODV_02115 [Candidatus Limnocylindrus sp.]